MKQCPNPDCPVHQSGRLFNADDTICPRCGSDLLPIGATVVAVPAPDPTLGRVAAVLGAIVILLVVFGLALGAAGLLGGLMPQPTPVIPAALPDTIPAATALASADATHTAVAAGSNLPNTPVVSLPTATSNVTPLPPSTGAGATTGGSTINSGTTSGTGVDTAAGATSAIIPGVSGWRLCRRIAAGEPCEPVSAYGPRDAFNLAVQAGFGPGGATTIRVRWYGPNGILLYATDPVTPGRTGTYWVAFTLTQSQPWLPGVYRAEIYLDEALYRQVDIVVVQ